MQNTLRMLVVAAILGGGLLYKVTVAQEGNPSATDAGPVAPFGAAPIEAVPTTGPEPDAPYAGAIRMVPRIRTVVEYVREPVPQEELDEQKSITKAVQSLSSATDEPTKVKATAGLQHLLERAFTRDLDQREKQIADVESRVKKLRDQIEKRKKAKEQIIDLRLKTIVNDAEGLGFPTPLPLGGPREKLAVPTWESTPMVAPATKDPFSRENDTSYPVPGSKRRPPAAIEIEERHHDTPDPNSSDTLVPKKSDASLYSKGG